MNEIELTTSKNTMKEIMKNFKERKGTPNYNSSSNGEHMESQNHIMLKLTSSDDDMLIKERNG